MTKTIRLIIIIPIFITIFLACSTDKQKPKSMKEEMQKTTVIDFWNGNRSGARQIYERKVLIAILEATEEKYGKWKIKESLEDYPGNAESLAFSEKNHDVLITIAGNQKFKKEDMIVIPQLLTKNLLGYRIPIIRKEDKDLFSQIIHAKELQELNHGIPVTWSDATVFRYNKYKVVEKGNFDDIFKRLQNKEFDYCTFGANEVLEVYQNRATKQKGLLIDQNILLFYPFPLVFYVNPDQPKIAERIEKGLQSIINSGKLNSIFDEHYGQIKKQLSLDSRTVFVLDNPLVPDEFRDLTPDLKNL